MPNRVIKESIKYSAEIDQLTWFETVCFINLMVTVDDYGRYYANPLILKNDLFPTKEDVTKAMIQEAFHKLEALHLISTYAVDGKWYLQLVTWDKHQRIRNMTSKFPAPVDNNCQQSAVNCQQVADNCVRNPIQSNQNYNPNPTTTDAELLKVSDDHNEIFDLWENCKWDLNEVVMGALVELYGQYGIEKMLAAIRTTAEASPKAPMQYLRAVLSGKGKKPVQKTGLTKTVNAQAFTQREWADDTSDMDAMMEGLA